MKAFFSPDQLLHDPQQFMRLGRIAKPTDLPTRAEALNRTLAAHGINVVEPQDYGFEPLTRVHSADYLDFLASAYPRWEALREQGLNPGIEVLPNLSPFYSGRVDAPRPPCPSPSIVAQTGYYLSDLSCPLGPNSWRSILRSAHAAVAAADAVIEGEHTAYALCRPSGHHAHRDRAGGFCYVNNSATAAAHLRQHFGRVAVFDVDAHHGDGTQNIFYADPDVLTVSTHADTQTYYPFYTGYAHERGWGDGEGFNLNLPMPHGANSATFLAAVDQGCAAIHRYAPEAVVLALGFDTLKDDPISVLGVEIEAYQAVGQRVAALGVPVVVVQEGGYLVEAIGQALDYFLKGLHG